MVPDTYTGTPEWDKIVVMDHMEMDYLQHVVKEIVSADKGVKIERDIVGRFKDIKMTP